MTESLGTLFSGSNQFFKTHINPILIGALVFGIIIGSMQYVLERKMMHSVQNHMGEIEQMEDLVERMEAGDPTAFEEMMNEMGVSEDGTAEVNTAKSAQIAEGFIKGVMPTFAVFFVIMILVSMTSSVYFLLLVIRNAQSAGSVFSEIQGYIFPMIGLWIWMFLRSFVWIPLLGFVIAIFIGPRLALAPVILLRENKGVLESTRQSYTMSRGYWGKITGNLLVMALCVWVVMMIALVAAGAITAFVPVLGMTIMSVLQYVSMAYGTIFTVRLSDTILQNPLKK